MEYKNRKIPESMYIQDDRLVKYISAIRYMSVPMAKRHKLDPKDRESILLRLQELLMANSGEDAYEEAFKLLVGKLYDELTSGNLAESRFATKKTATLTRQSINELLRNVDERWPGTLESPTTGLSDDHLAVCVAEIAPLRLLDKNIEIIDDLFEHLVSADAKGNKGQYFTPRHVIDFAVQLLKPRPGETIVDPSCGSGGFLVHALNYSRNHFQNTNPRNETELWGFDFDPRAVRVARTLMRIAGVETPNVYALNSLVKLRSQELLFADDDLDEEASTAVPTIETVLDKKNGVAFDGFDVLFANPPFAGEIRETHILNSYECGEGREAIERDALFFERCIELVRPGGRFAIVLPHNKLAGSTWSDLRRWVMRRAKISIVVGLPRPTFMPHTHQKTALIVGEKRLRVLSHSPKEEEIMFAVSDEIGKDNTGRLKIRPGANDFASMWERADHDLQTILDDYAVYAASREVA